MLTAPLDGCTIAISGAFPGTHHSQTSIREDVKELGALIAKSITLKTTHLVASNHDVSDAKVRKAVARGDIYIVGVSWLEQCSSLKSRVDEAPYLLSPHSMQGDSSVITPIVATPAIGSDTHTDNDDVTIQSLPKKKARVSKKNDTALAESSTKSFITGTPEPTNIAKYSNLEIPTDKRLGGGMYPVYLPYVVYINPENMIIYDATLNMSVSGRNSNKFYIVQIAHDTFGTYNVFTRWGRVGDNGQRRMLGDGSLHSAMTEFLNKFKNKTGLSWESRGNTPKPGKYTFVEKSYELNSGDISVKTPESDSTIDSVLQPEVQRLMQLIFNHEFFSAAMKEMNYDAQKLPLGKLAKSTINRGYQALKDLATLLDNTQLARDEYDTNLSAAAEQLSNAYYTLIPHVFGRRSIAVLNSLDAIKLEIGLLDSLVDMKNAADIMKSDNSEEIHLLDQQFKGLNMHEMTPLQHESGEFIEIRNYLVGTRASTHSIAYTINEIYRIERNDEKDRFFENTICITPRDRRLLWHGSRCTNFGGILSQGLRIAPPEAPVSGYMFGKGIYLADMSSKSAGYCVPDISDGNALLLLCEAELGDPMQHLTNAAYDAGDNAKAKGMSSTWGQGMFGPSKWKDASCIHPALKGTRMPDTSVPAGATMVKDAYLQYNEYVAYDVEQVRLRYLLHIQIS